MKYRYSIGNENIVSGQPLLRKLASVLRKLQHHPLKSVRLRCQCSFNGGTQATIETSHLHFLLINNIGHPSTVQHSAGETRGSCGCHSTQTICTNRFAICDTQLCEQCSLNRTWCALSLHTHNNNENMFWNSLRSTNRSLNSQNAPGSKWVPTWCLATNTTQGLLFIITPGKYASWQKKMLIPQVARTCLNHFYLIWCVLFCSKMISITYILIALSKSPFR